MLLAGDEAVMDLGRLSDGRRFAIGVGVGLDATMISEAPARLKKRFGFMAYVIGGYKAVIRNQKFNLRLTVDGVVYERQASAVLVANLGAVLNDLVSFGDGIVHDDGVLNACVFSPQSLGDALRILWRMLRKDFSPDPCLFYQIGARIPHRDHASDARPGRRRAAARTLHSRSPSTHSPAVCSFRKSDKFVIRDWLLRLRALIRGHKFRLIDTLKLDFVRSRRRPAWIGGMHS